MLLQTNSYIVPKDKRPEHQRLIRRFRQTLKRLGCDHFEVYEQVGPNWSASESSGRYVQILRFVDRKHQLSVQQAERSDPTAQAVIADFCDLINFPYQQQQGLFAVGFYNSVLPVAPKRGTRGELISTVEHEVVDEPEAELSEVNGTDLNGVDAMAGGTGAEAAVALDRELAADADAAAALHAPPRDMIDTVIVDDSTMAPGELHDVLGADAPVHNLEGTPAETELVTKAGHVPSGLSPDSSRSGLGDDDFDVTPEDDDARGANGFVLEDAAELAPPDAHRANRPQW